MNEIKNLKKVIVITAISIIGVILVVILLLSFGLCTGCGLFVKPFMTFRKTVTTCGTCELNRNASERTSKVLRELQEEIIARKLDYEIQGRDLPDTLEKWISVLDLPRDLYLYDGWRNPFQYRKDEAFDFIIVSAGPDRIFDTEDDIIGSSGVTYKNVQEYIEDRDRMLKDMKEWEKKTNPRQ